MRTVKDTFLDELLGLGPVLELVIKCVFKLRPLECVLGSLQCGCHSRVYSNHHTSQ